MAGRADGRTRLGVLTPSSNTVLEPMTAAMLAGLDDVTAHFGRFRVREIALHDAALGQFDRAPVLAAADLLADLHPGAIVWSGTSAGWLGFATDQALADAITARTGVAAGSSVLALNEIFATTRVARFGLVTPYTADVQERIVASYGAAGFACIAERHLGISENFAFSQVDEDEVAAMIRAVAAAGPDAITVFCTNMRGARLVEDLEREIGIPIYDTVATAVWKGMRLAGADPARVHGCGRLFRELR